MRFAFAALFFIATLWSSAALSEPESYDSAEDFIRSIPHASVESASIAQGDLNGDDLEDLAIVVQIEPEGFTRYNQLHILTQEASGKFTPAISTKQSPTAGMGCCWLEYMEIKKGSLYLQNNAKTACNMEAATHQFKLYKGTWRLIGLKLFNYQHCDEPQIIAVRDVNILTGKIIDSLQVNDEPAQYQTLQFAPQRVLLEDYDFFNGFGAPDVPRNTAP